LPSRCRIAFRTPGKKPLHGQEKDLRGHQGLKASHGQVLAYAGPEGGRIHEIARLQGVSRQAISTIAKELETLGYLARRPDPRDRRGVVLQLSRRGEELVRDTVDALDELERAFRDVLGQRRLAQLERVARDLYQAVAPESGDAEIEQLATRLERRLGRDDAARLAALLEARAFGGGS